jgi:hypothetical protein
MTLKPERKLESFSNDDLNVAIGEASKYLNDLPMGMRVSFMQAFYAEKDKTYSLILLIEQKGA